MSIAEPGADGVVADDVPAFYGYAWEFLRAVASVLVSENILFADILCAWGVLAECFAREKGLTPVFPDDCEFGADELYVFRFHDV